MKNYKLWYKQSADMFEEALPTGNGHMGMMTYGGIRDELLEINNDTLWSGHKKNEYNKDAKNHIDKARELIDQGKYNDAQDLIEDKMLGHYGQSYMPLGNIRLQFRYKGFLKKSDYKRCLDLSCAKTFTSYKIDNMSYTRENFISYPDNVAVYKISAQTDFDLFISMDSKMLYDVNVHDDNSILMQGTCPSHVEPSYRTDEALPIIYNVDDPAKSLKFAAIASIITNGHTANA